MVTAQTTEAIVETTIEAITEVAKIAKCQTKTPKATNLPTEEATTPKEEEDKTEEVEVAITHLAITPKEEEDKIPALCRACSVNSVAKKDTEKTNVTQR